MVVVSKVDAAHQKHNKSSPFVKLAIDFFGFIFSFVAMWKKVGKWAASRHEDTNEHQPALHETNKKNSGHV